VSWGSRGVRIVFMSAFSDSRTRIGSRGLVAVLVALSLASCGGSTSSSSVAQPAARTSGAAGATTASSTATASRPAATTTVTKTSTSPAGGPSRCVASELTLSFLGQNGGMGHGELGFALRNSSARSCRTQGYPGVLFLGPGGQPLPTNSKRTTLDFFGHTPVVAIVLTPGQSASFRLGVTHEPTATGSCTTAAGLQVIAPDDTATLRTAIAQGAYECGTATVSPLQPGTSAYR
jgi:hypothetical protein